MVGLYLSIWVHHTLRKHIRGLQLTTVRNGRFGLLGNKGSVIARFRVFDSGLTIVCSHFSSGETPREVEKRRQDFHDTVRKAKFPPEKPVLMPAVLPDWKEHLGSKEKQMLAKQELNQKQ